MPGSPNPIDDLPPGGAATCENAKKILCHMEKVCVTRKKIVQHGDKLKSMDKFSVTWKQIEINGNKKRCTLLLFFSPIPTKRCSAAIALHTNLYKSPAIGGCHS